MNKFRFSPINSEKELSNAISYLHQECWKLVKSYKITNLKTAGNIAVFCHSNEEYEFLTKLQKINCKQSSDPNQKYFELINPIQFETKDNIPASKYKWLYIRKPTKSSSQVGDIDFVLPKKDYLTLKQSVKNNVAPKDLKIYERVGWDMIEINNPTSDVLPYIITQEMSQKVRKRF